MPYCEVTSHKTSLNSQLNNGIKIFYRTYGRGPTKVLLIIGLAGTHESWGPQIEGLTGSDKPNDGDETTAGECCDNEAGFGGDGFEVCAFDNRGMGRSSVPTKKSEYTTRIMAKDAIALLDHLGWAKAHVFGHSMGAMIASKVAAMVPERVLSLALLNVTGGGFECLPKFDRQSLSIAIRFLKAKTPEQRAAVDLDTHYSKVTIALQSVCHFVTTLESFGHSVIFLKSISHFAAHELSTMTNGGAHYSNFKLAGATLTIALFNYVQEYLEEYVASSSTTRREILYQEYVKGISSTGMQSNYGFEGQLNACWTHKMTRTEIELIRAAGFLVSVIHGRHDVIAQIYHARRLAQKLYPVTRMVDLHGGHLVSHERTEEVNKALLELIMASKMGIKPHEWTNLPNKSFGWMEIRTSHSRTNTEGGSNVSFMSNMLDKVYLCLLYLFGLFVLIFEFAKKTMRRLKPVRVGASLT
ncbi:hypothetical protein TIFTF001_013574 [Ficus carica]|uniref:AB hydrolase-1 domain-containing protein n=1 Tax=Ficus carica TaxID=3494 RepID=A0AA88D304_FICCA|nr:hypothetical protein TIFTF001_013574 [Ficus carica]